MTALEGNDIPHQGVLSRACSMASFDRAVRSPSAIRGLALVVRPRARVAPRANIAS